MTETKKKWRDANTYKKTITFYNSKLPIKTFNKAIENIKADGNSFNNFISNKLKEMGER